MSTSAAKAASERLAQRSAQEFDEAIRAEDSVERWIHAYRSARSAAGAVVVREGDFSGKRRRCRGSRDVWTQLQKIRPELTPWASVLREYGKRHADLEVGMPRSISPRAATDVLWAVERFRTVVDDTSSSL